GCTASRRPRAHRGRPAAGGRLPPLRVRLPGLRPLLVEAAAVAPCPRGAGGDAVGAAGARAPRPAGHGAAAARPLDQRHGDVPRPELLQGAAGEGRADPADVSVRARVERGLLDGRGDVLAGDRAGGGGAARPQPHLRDRHQRRRARARPLGPLPAREDEAVHGELRACGRHGRLLALLQRAGQRGGVRAVAGQRGGVRAAQPRPGRVVQRVPARRVPERPDLLRAPPAGTRPRPVPRQPRAFRRARPGSQGIRDPVARGALRGAGPDGEALPAIAM
ncbi:MAG: MCP methyltransferase, CheR-type, partial [uncultured Solirubrobacteraceae bacterium]